MVSVCGRRSRGSKGKAALGWWVGAAGRGEWRGGGGARPQKCRTPPVVSSMAAVTRFLRSVASRVMYCRRIPGGRCGERTRQR